MLPCRARLPGSSGQNSQHQQIGGKEDRYRAIPGFLPRSNMISYKRPQLVYRYAESFCGFVLGILGFRCFQQRYGWAAGWIHGMF